MKTRIGPFLVLLACATPAAPADDRPNILLIMADDLSSNSRR